MLASLPMTAAGPLLAATLLLAAPQGSPPSREKDATPPPPAPVRVHPLSPRASLQSFLDLCRAGRFGPAAVHLDMDTTPGGAGATAARRLKEVLDRHLWFDMDAVSPEPGGDGDDGLAPDRELLGTIPTPEGDQDVLMIRRGGGEPPGWVFAPGTVARIDEWYAQLDRNWLRERMPASLVRPGPLELQWWQWAALPVAVLLAWLASRLTGAVLRPLIRHLTSRTRSEIDDLLLEKLEGPVLLALALALFRSETVFLDLTLPAQGFIDAALRAVLLLAVFWGLTRLVDVAVVALERSAWMDERPEIRAFLPFGARVGRLVVLALGLVTVLQEFNFTVTGLLAGMGLAGMAAALAGQKSIENLLGSATILADRPFLAGHFVRVDDLVGTVESIGLRSTRIRTLDRTLVTIPNGRLSEMRLETFAARDRIRLACTLGLTYSTTTGQMTEVLSGIEAVLREHPRVAGDPLRVRFAEFGDSALKIEILAYLETTDFNEFLALRQGIYLQFMRVVEENGCAFAFPTRTLHVEPAEVTLRRPDGSGAS